MFKCDCCDNEARNFYSNEDGVILCDIYCVIKFYELKPFEYHKIGGDSIGKN